VGREKQSCGQNEDEETFNGCDMFHRRAQLEQFSVVLCSKVVCVVAVSKLTSSVAIKASGHEFIAASGIATSLVLFHARRAVAADLIVGIHATSKTALQVSATISTGIVVVDGASQRVGIGSSEGS
jgi:hypothetical protein